MKKLLIGLLAVTMLSSCSPSKSELYEKIDFFVHSLNTTYESYAIIGGTDHSQTTSDGLYKINPVGRMIHIKIMKVVSEDVYEDLKEDLKDHYKNDDQVNNVYINGGGTIMVDCRN